MSHHERDYNSGGGSPGGAQDGEFPDFMCQNDEIDRMIEESAGAFNLSGTNIRNILYVSILLLSFLDQSVKLPTDKSRLGIDLTTIDPTTIDPTTIDPMTTDPVTTIAPSLITVERSIVTLEPQFSDNFDAIASDPVGIQF